ncbi:MAG: hypothetical protein GWN86_11675, partial [Desulfobacterales bacterium]|nr:hypothetical protein [Desulfobacterales bacterium]
MFHVRIGFGLYGCMKTNAGDEIGEVQFRAGYIPSGCTLEMKSHRSRNGYKYENATLSGLYYQSGKSIVQTACFFLQFAKIHPVIGGIVLGIEGVMLFSDWIELTSSVTDPESGVDEPASYVNFKYDPEDEYEEPGDGYRYGEFQSMIFLELNVDMTGREQWTIVPMQWRIYMLDASGGTGTYVTGDISIAIYDNYYKDGYEAVVFFEDFKEDMSGWSTGDTNSLAGYDYWGITQYGGPGYKAWCATVGNNSVKGGTNEEQGFYDKGMNASLTRSVDLRPYQSVILRYHLWYVISSGDHLKVEYYQGGAWATADTLTGSEWIDYWEETIIPTSAEKIRFRFYSNDDNDVGYGVFINHIELVAEMPNDANTTTDAGDGFDDSIHIGISETKINYPGYLNDDEDFYGFSISSDDVANERIIEVQVHPPSATKFKATLYDPYEEKKAGPATSIYYALSAEDTAGEWWIKIYPVKGFGPYDFDTRLKTPSGGCPYISAWNGEEYVLDNNLLLASEHTLGDVTDYYRLEQSLVANLDGTYSLLLSEFENEHDYFDRVQLLAVDHTPNISVAVSRSGEILTYKNPYTPKSAVDDNEENVKHLLTHVDGKYYQGYNASHIILNFGNLDTCNGAKLVLRSDEIIKWSIHVQIQDDNGEWRDVASFIPRAYWSTDIINLSKFLKDEEGAIKVRLHFTAEHKLDYVGLDTSPQAKINIQYGELLSAIHTSEGD